jgi:aerobic-type carbon monoxide dehydrogenase small subunit (CoxS/CutS family)
VELACSVNGLGIVREVAPQELLLDFLRDSLGLTGAKRSCDVQVCGACTVLVDGLPISSCCFLAVDANAREVTTIEGLADRPEFEPLEDAFTRHAALQCGFCTPGFLLTVSSLLEHDELSADQEEIKHDLAGNLCRCTGYRGILEAVAELSVR